MTLVVKGVAELFRLVRCEKELHQEMLTLSILHDNRMVRIYSHYLVINGKVTTFYHHPIHTFDFIALDGKEKWTTSKFTSTVYDIWMPAHFKRICSVLDESPPNVNFDISKLQSLKASRLSQIFNDQSLSKQSNPDTASLVGNVDSQSSLAGSITPNTSLSHGTEQGVFNRPKKQRTVE